MALKFVCPGCNKDSSVRDITMDDSGEWQCPRCKGDRDRDAWFGVTQARKGSLPVDWNTYFYSGAKTKQKLGAGIFRGLVRKDIFAGGDYRNIRGPQAKPFPVKEARDKNVTIYLVKDEVTLSGKFYTPPNVACNKVILFLSGSGATQGLYADQVIDGYLRMGARILCVDYRGFGRSTGTPSSRGTYSDAEAMLAYLTGAHAECGEGIPKERVVVHGYSLGSGPATELAKRDSAGQPPLLAGLVLHCPMSSSAANARRIMGGGRVGAIAGRITAWGHAYNNLDKIAHVRIPIHIITGENDDMAEQGTQLYERARTRGAETTQFTTTRHSYGRWNGGDHENIEEIFDSGDLMRFIVGLP